MKHGKPGEIKTPIDWEAVRRRIAAANNAFEQGAAQDPAKRKKILSQRAGQLARETGAAQTGETIEVVEFTLAYERYAIETAFVREVVPLKDLTPVPCTPDFVLGIVNVRGQIVSAIDIKKFFDLPEKGLTDLNKLLILRSEAMEFGVLADTIAGVSAVPLSYLQPAPPTFTGLREEYLRGVTPEGLAVLDAEKLLSDRNIIVDEEV